MKRVLIGVLAIGILLPATVFATSVHGGSTYTLAEGETNEGSLYAAGGTVTIAGTVTGDIAVAGGQVTISGEAKKDVLVAGGTVTVTGVLSEDVRVTGGDITIDTTVPGDVLVAGGNVTISSDTIIEGDLVIAGGSVMVRGEVRGELRGAGGDVILSGPVGGNVNLVAGEVTLEATARLAGDFAYQSPKEATIVDGATIAGTTTFTERHYKLWGNVAFGMFNATIISWLIGLITMITAAIVFTIVFKRFSGLVATQGAGSFWKRVSLGGGILFATPFIAGILFFSIVGSFLGVLLVIAYVLYLLLAGLYAGVIAGAVIFKWIQKGPVRFDWIAAVLGVLVLNLLSLIPVIGWAFGLIFFMAALGSLVTVKKDLLEGKAK